MRPKKKRGFLDGYKTYDPEVEGYGNVNEWRAAWKRMGHNEAAWTIGHDDPLTIMGFTTTPTKRELDHAFFKLVKQHHPDHGGDPEMFKKIHAAWSLLGEAVQ